MRPPSTKPATITTTKREPPFRVSKHDHDIEGKMCTSGTETSHSLDFSDKMLSATGMHMWRKCLPSLTGWGRSYSQRHSYVWCSPAFLLIFYHHIIDNDDPLQTFSTLLADCSIWLRAFIPRLCPESLFQRPGNWNWFTITDCEIDNMLHDLCEMFILMLHVLEIDGVPRSLHSCYL